MREDAKFNFSTIFITTLLLEPGIREGQLTNAQNGKYVSVVLRCESEVHISSGRQP